jgi:hypothetical protein
VEWLRSQCNWKSDAGYTWFCPCVRRGRLALTLIRCYYAHVGHARSPRPNQYPSSAGTSAQDQHFVNLHRPQTTTFLLVAELEYNLLPDRSVRPGLFVLIISCNSWPAHRRHTFEAVHLRGSARPYGCPSALGVGRVKDTSFDMSCRWIYDKLSCSAVLLRPGWRTNQL